jgi:hypothetical protein
MKHGKIPPQARMAGLAATALGLAIWAMYPQTAPPNQDRVPRTTGVPGGRSGGVGSGDAAFQAKDSSAPVEPRGARTRDPARVAMERERKLMRQLAASDQESGSAPRESKRIAPPVTGWRELPAHTVPDDEEEVEDPASSRFHLIEEATLAAESGTGDTGKLLGELRAAFFQEEDLQVRQSLLTVAHELSAEGSEGMVMEALDASQPEEIRRAALYLVSDDLELLVSIAADKGNELQADAAGLILERKLAAGEVPPPVETPVEER